MNKYHIRFNHNHQDAQQVWRVFENGVENLVASLKILAPVFDEMTVENGVKKWNICCYGYLTIVDGTATIR